VIELYRRIQNTGRPVDALALNAGIGAGGAFATETELQEQVQTVAGKVIPDSKKAEMHRQMAEPGSAKED